MMKDSLAFDHVALALTNRRHIDFHGAGHCTESLGMPRQMRNSCAPDLVLARQASDRGTRSAYPLALDDGNLPARPRKMPGKQFASLSAAEDQHFVVFFS
jgi:hypothetical protein